MLVIFPLRMFMKTMNNNNNNNNNNNKNNLKGYFGINIKVSR